MVQDDTAGSPAGGAGIEAGGYIDLGTNVTSVTVTVEDKNGKVIYGPTATTSDGKVDPVAHGVTMPLRVTITAISDGTAAIIYWWVKK